MKNNIIKTFVFASLFSVFSLVSLSSCIEDVKEPTKEITRYRESDIKSYADLFEVFWTVMDQKYNYFYEQEGKSWRDIYKEYYPKFAALKTYTRDPSFTLSEMKAEYDLADKYFTDIIDPIRDVHFSVRITMPISHTHNMSPTYYGGMKNEELTSYASYDFKDKFKYMLNYHINKETVLKSNDSDLIAGYIKNEPDIYYFGFNQFMLSKNYIPFFFDNYLRIDIDSEFYVTEETIRYSDELKAIEDPIIREKIEKKTIEFVNKFNTYMNTSPLLKAVLKDIDHYRQTEEFTDEVVTRFKKLAVEAPDFFSEISELMDEPEFDEAKAFNTWFFLVMKEHLEVATGYSVLMSDVKYYASETQYLEFFSRFANPLKKGEIKKIIIDLRGNGGGYVVDARNFTDRFITKNKIFAYQRFKEDNNPYGYTPWAPAYTQVSEKSMGKEIPIVVLIDKHSVSMSEISTLMLRSQGKHVTVVGDYSAGGLAGLGDSDAFNGGVTEKIAGCLQFYMPLLAIQDANHNVIEGIGIKPDVMVEPLKKSEVEELKTSPETHVDRALQKAIEIIQQE